jgi:hypothetical protein
MASTTADLPEARTKVLSTNVSRLYGIEVPSDPSHAL